jgi:excisionase family DNA binding protein
MPLVTIRKAAEMLGVHEETLYRWIRSGKLVGCVIRLPSGRIRIDRGVLVDELRAYGDLLSSRRRGGVGGLNIIRQKLMLFLSMLLSNISHLV